MKVILPSKDKSYILRNRLRLSSRKIAAHIGHSKTFVSRFLKARSLTPPANIIEQFRIDAFTGGSSFTKRQDEIIKREYLLIPIKTLARKIGRSHVGVNHRIAAMGLVIPIELRRQRKAIGMYRKGQVAFNKGKKQTEFMSAEAIKKTKPTRFKKGHVPHNTIPGIGMITIRTDLRTGRKYKYIKLGLANWRELHRHNWEKKHGKIPKGMCVVFKDGNNMDCRVKNLELITRVENMIRNTIHRYTPEIKSGIRIINKLKRTINEKRNQ
jgi:hypothetical protein